MSTSPNMTFRMPARSSGCCRRRAAYCLLRPSMVREACGHESNRRNQERHRSHQGEDDAGPEYGRHIQRYAEGARYDLARLPAAGTSAR